MDWTAAIDHHRTALIRVVGVIAAMAGFSIADASPSTAAPLPRRLHRAVLAMLRPAEAAARRLIVIAARGLTLPPRPPRPQPVVPVVWRAPAAVRRTPRAPSLALLDTLRGLPRRPRARADAIPRIRVVGFSEPPLPLRAVPKPDDPLAAADIHRRLAALSSALGDLPRQARRFVRWRGRRDAAWARGRRHRFGPLRPGRPPGWRHPGSRHAREVHKTLDDLHGLAFFALAHPDSS